MGAVYFYHLSQSTLEQALPQLLAKALQAGWQVEVRGRTDDQLAWLDRQLWLGPEDGFLPHGRAGGPHDALQPILLTKTGQAAENAPVCIMAVDGAELSADEIGAAERACFIFDGADDARLTHARGQWKALTEAGCAAQYWAQEDGRWIKKAEKAA